VLWVSPFGFNFLESGDCFFFIGRTYLCLYFVLFLFLTFSREGVCLPMSLNVNGAFVSFGLRGLCRLHIGLRGLCRLHIGLRGLCRLHISLRS
jgi:hypothetical protein